MVLLGRAARDDGGRRREGSPDKVARLRVFDERGAAAWTARCSTSAGRRLCVSQFTLYGDTRRGLRPSFTEAAEPAAAERLYEPFCERLRGAACRSRPGGSARGCRSRSRNEGPVTLLLEA